MKFFKKMFRVERNAILLTWVVGKNNLTRAWWLVWGIAIFVIWLFTATIIKAFWTHLSGGSLDLLPGTLGAFAFLLPAAVYSAKVVDRAVGRS